MGTINLSCDYISDFIDFMIYRRNISMRSTRAIISIMKSHKKVNGLKLRIQLLPTPTLATVNLIANPMRLSMKSMITTMMTEMTILTKVIRISNALGG